MLQFVIKSLYNLETPHVLFVVFHSHIQVHQTTPRPIHEVDSLDFHLVGVLNVCRIDVKFLEATMLNNELDFGVLGVILSLVDSNELRLDIYHEERLLHLPQEPPIRAEDHEGCLGNTRIRDAQEELVVI